jgi:hypothetical protein
MYQYPKTIHKGGKKCTKRYKYKKSGKKHHGGKYTGDKYGGKYHDKYKKTKKYKK